MIILLLINILELLAIVYLLWILFEQVMNYEHLNDLHDNALSILDKTRQRQEKLEILTNIQGRVIKEIKEIAKNSNTTPCMNIYCNCEKCNDDITDNGETCMRKGLKRILKVIEENLDE